jgi:hypothetical protein
MASRMISVRVSPEADQRLSRAARASGASRSALLNRYIEEGLRMDAHPGIVFRPGPAGRRAALAGGPDVWEVARVVRNSEARGDAAIEMASQWLGLQPAQVRVAIDYYSRFRDEIDAWLDRLDDRTRQAREDAALRQAVLQ